VKPTLVDTDILSYFFRGYKQVVTRVSTYVAEYGRINLSIITYYEILSGLKHRDAHRQLSDFMRFVAENNVVPLTKDAVEYAAAMYAETRAQGSPVDDIDLLIAGIAMAHGLTLVTHNLSHFERIQGLAIEDWAK
jgi:tRNA(fMet)-specific endonuclease VapC